MTYLIKYSTKDYGDEENFKEIAPYGEVITKQVCPGAPGEDKVLTE